MHESEARSLATADHAERLHRALERAGIEVEQSADELAAEAAAASTIQGRYRSHIQARRMAEESTAAESIQRQWRLRRPTTQEEEEVTEVAEEGRDELVTELRAALEASVVQLETTRSESEAQLAALRAELAQAKAERRS